MKQAKGSKAPQWLLIFYSLPSRPVGNRVKIWRKLAKVGAISLKGAVYVLPYNEEHYELCQWIMAEVKAMGGEGDFVVAQRFEMLGNQQIVELFNHQRESDYKALEGKLNQLERRIYSIRKGGKGARVKAIRDKLDRCVAEFDQIRGIDFFSCTAGRKLQDKIQTLKRELGRLESGEGERATGLAPVSIQPKALRDYQGRVWVTRKKPYVDRMASAWLIKRFIDHQASFQFVDERKRRGQDPSHVTFDMAGAEFTHVGDLCTFEVLTKAFGIKDKVVRKIAEIVHDLDMKDEKFRPSDARGLESVLMGIRKTAKDDMEALEKGIEVFEMLYASKTKF